MSVNVTLILVPEDDGVRVTDVLISVDLDKMTLEMECLFPRNGKCCPRKYLKSCNTILTKTILRYSKLSSSAQRYWTLCSFRFINRDGKRFIKDFQQEISAKVKHILLDHLNK